MHWEFGHLAHDNPTHLPTPHAVFPGGVLDVFLHIPSCPRPCLPPTPIFSLCPIIAVTLYSWLVPARKRQRIRGNLWSAIPQRDLLDIVKLWGGERLHLTYSIESQGGGSVILPLDWQCYIMFDERFEF